VYETSALYKRMKQALKEMIMAGSYTQDVPNLTKEAAETQKRLLDAAEELFAQKGLDGTTIRDITTKAGRNTASINYFFGNKQELYEELFRQRLREMCDSRLKAIKAVMAGKARPTLEKLLHAYSVDFLKPFSDPQRSQRFMQLFFRELAEQRLPKNMFLDEMAAPTLTAMEEAIAAICPNINKHDALMCALSLTGQLVHIMQVKVLFEGAPGLASGESRGGQGHSITSIDIDDAIGHIVKFSAAGVRYLAKGDNK
jgi:TetR/AcrR family transcriptional regulator, regulator of cefoperazone and chloramphenicol sensitivity